MDIGRYSHVRLDRVPHFSPETSEECAKAAAKESGADGVQVTFAPMADLVRDSRWGRVMESTGEDPYLNSLMAAAMVKGFQGDDIGEKGTICLLYQACGSLRRSSGRTRLPEC